LKPNSLCYTHYGWPHTEIFLRAWKDAGLRPVSIFALIKDNWRLGYFSRSQHEHAYLLAKGRPLKPEAAISVVIECQHVSPHLHANQEPLGATSTILNCYCPKRGNVLDLFCGSGTDASSSA